MSRTKFGKIILSVKGKETNIGFAGIKPETELPIPSFSNCMILNILFKLSFKKKVVA